MTCTASAGAGVRAPGGNFALIGAAGFVAPRHMQAIRDVGGRLVAATDPHDSVGVIDGYFEDAHFFTEIERFDRHVDELRRGPPEDRVDRVVVCTPNYLHDAHIRMALRSGCDVICEKPIVIDPADLDALTVAERQTGRRVHTVLQLRHHPTLRALRERVAAGPARVHDVDLRYVTRRGRWYHASWKGDESKSGGLVMNIGVHFFDALLWIFGGVRSLDVTLRGDATVVGTLELERARVRWLLSIDAAHLPTDPAGQRADASRVLTVDGASIDFSTGFRGLHSTVYREVLAGRGLGIEDARPAIDLVDRVRHAVVRSAPRGLPRARKVVPAPERRIARSVG